MDPDEERRKAFEHTVPNPSQRYQYNTAYATKSSGGTVPDATEQARYRPSAVNLTYSGAGSLRVESSYPDNNNNNNNNNSSRSSSSTQNVTSAQNYQREATSTFPAANMAQPMMGYGQNYGTDSRGHPTTGFAGYGGSSMSIYNMPPGHAAAQAPVYDAHQFSTRHSASVQMMAPDAAPPYFHMAPGASSMHSLGQNPEDDLYGHQGSALSYHASTRSTDEAQAPVVSSSNVDRSGGPSNIGTLSAHEAVEEKLASFKQQLESVFDEISRGQLARAAATLLRLSNWFLTQITDLGLHLDDRERHKERLRLWENFNNAWLALFVKQIELMSSPFAIPHQALMTKKTVKEMGDELIRLCDGLERHGLVDYQYGVWEERIEAVLENCLDLFEPEVNERGG